MKAATPKQTAAMKATSPKPSTAMKASAPSHAKSQGAYGVQLGAFKSGATAANQRWASLEKQYPKVLSGLSPKVLPSKSASGTLYRLQVASLSQDRADSICKALKAGSQPCVLLHP
jgi:cell division protein FtsN